MPGSNHFLIKAKAAVSETQHIAPMDLYIVWFCKALENWKALISTDLVSGKYWEVTYNGAKGETYVDTYSKESNVSIPDGRI